MNKGILFVGAISHQHIQGFSAAIRRYSDYKLYGIDYSSSTEYSESFEEVVSVKSSEKYILNQIKRVICPIFYICRMRKKIQIVQFHSFSIYAFIAAPFSRLLGLSVSYFIWGSDLMRAGKMKQFLAHIVYKSCHSVVCDSNSVADIFKVRYPRLHHKLEVLYFGSPIIDALQQRPKQVIAHNSDKITVMCGYNGSPEQNHNKILRALEPFKNKIQVILPMTYRTTKAYINTIRQYLSDTGFSYVILDSFLTDDEWANYEMKTDIFIHMQDTDAFSSSVAEHLLLGNVLINADWIQYPDLTNNGIRYETANFDNLADVFEQVLLNYASIKSVYADNCEKIYVLKSQSYCVQNYWIPYYDRVLFFSHRD